MYDFLNWDWTVVSFYQGKFSPDSIGQEVHSKKGPKKDPLHLQKEPFITGKGLSGVKDGTFLGTILRVSWVYK